MLHPFLHQVGGRSSMLCLDEHTICKPLIPRELRFYETLPDEVRRFAPKFKGVIEVSFTEDTDGSIQLEANLPKLLAATVSEEEVREASLRPISVDKRASRGLLMRRSGSIEIESELQEVFEDDQMPTTSQGGGRGHNPWVLKCHRNQLKKIVERENPGQSQGNAFTQEFILLENLTWRFKFPCVLDLKMGIRQYGDDATPEKKRSQSARVTSTTSGQLGIRLSGMQVYQVNQGKFICRNKYYGRGLNVEGFKSSIRQFFHNGEHMRGDVLPFVVQRLQDLESVLVQQDSFRFYTSSLLVIYEGMASEELSNTKSPVDHTASASCVSNITSMVPNVRSKSAETWKPSESRNQSSHLPAVDVRIIDFAHSTHKGFTDDPVAYSGPDRGFMFGLENLISLFNSIANELASG